MDQDDKYVKLRRFSTKLLSSDREVLPPLAVMFLHHGSACVPFNCQPLILGWAHEFQPSSVPNSTSNKGGGGKQEPDSENIVSYDKTQVDLLRAMAETEATHLNRPQPSPQFTLFATWERTFEAFHTKFHLQERVFVRLRGQSELTLVSDES